MLGKLLDGRYQVVQVLSGGGFGQTYIAEDIHRPTHPKCVVKHLKPVTHNPEFLKTARRLFTSEAETLEELGHHDQIPRLLAYFEEDEEFFLVQEFIQGHTLKAELGPGHRWTESKVIELLQQVLNILKFVHSYQVIHRDIKPNNIIRRQKDSKLVLIDFGAVKQIQTQLIAHPGQIDTTVAIGTPGYMSTEQGRGRPRPNSDIYSLGIIAIQALTGLYPTQLEEDSDTGEIIWEQHAQVSPGLAAVVSRMVQHHFKERFQSATEALQSLQQLDPEAKTQSSQQGSLSQPPLPSPSTLFAPLSGHSSESITPTVVLPPEQYNRLEKMLMELVGPIAPALLRQVAAQAPTYEELVENLALHLAFYQQADFKQRAMLLLEEAPTKPVSKADKLSSNDSFVRQCEREMANLIGPIASFLVQKALKSSSGEISRSELVKVLAAEIPDPQQSRQFQQRLLS